MTKMQSIVYSYIESQSAFTDTIPGVICTLSGFDAIRVTNAKGDSVTLGTDGQDTILDLSKGEIVATLDRDKHWQNKAEYFEHSPFVQMMV